VNFTYFCNLNGKSIDQLQNGRCIKKSLIAFCGSYQFYRDIWRICRPLFDLIAWLIVRNNPSLIEKTDQTDDIITVPTHLVLESAGSQLIHATRTSLAASWRTFSRLFPLGHYFKLDQNSAKLP
jgi:hypothetical protein